MVPIHGVQVCAGPLLKFDNGGLPDWLSLWEGDFEGLLQFAGDYVNAVVSRYRGKVGMWQCASRVNVGECSDCKKNRRCNWRSGYWKFDEERSWRQRVRRRPQAGSHKQGSADGADGEDEGKSVHWFTVSIFSSMTCPVERSMATCTQ